MALATTPTATRAAVLTGPAITLSKAANMRGGPGTADAIVRTGKTGEVFAITGKAQANDGLWYQVELGGGKQGWIRSDLGRASGAVAGVPVVTNIPPTPKAAAAPTRAPAAHG
jgi:uncharacterized protein YgiM (DUF1202 family)